MIINFQDAQIAESIKSFQGGMEKQMDNFFTVWKELDSDMNLVFTNQGPQCWVLSYY